MLGLWLALPARNTYRSPSRMRLRHYACRLALFAALAASYLPMAFKSLRYDASLRVFTLDHFWIAAPLMLLVCILLWLRHPRAFEYAEFSTTPFRRS